MVWVAPPVIADSNMTDDNQNEAMLSDDGGIDRRLNMSESVDKITLTTKVKRGSGTRDQDTVKVKVKGNRPDGTAMKLRAVLDALDAEGVTDTLRNTQPDGGDE